MKNTNKALFSSVVALILCCSMLIGSTFAWFTDSVTSGTNIIAAGNLDVDVLTADGKSIQNQKTLFDDVTVWEPGAVAWENLTVINEGNLALMYEMSINFTNENYVIEADGSTTEYDLTDVLMVGLVEDGVKSTTREGVLDEVDEWVDLKSFVESGVLLEQDATITYGLVIYWEPRNDDNNWNVQNGKTVSDDYTINGEPALHIDLGVILHATQKDHEEDSYGPDYDANLDKTVEIDGIIYIYHANGDITLYKVTEDYTKSDLVVMEGVTALANYSFYYNHNVKNVTLSSTVRDLGQAFNSSSVETVILNEGLTTISNRAFRAATNLKNVTIPSTVTTIEEGAFQQSGLVEIVIPAGVTYIGKQALGYCPNLQKISILGDNVEIENYVARACASLVEVYMPGMNVHFNGTSMAFTNAESGKSGLITITVANKDVEAKLRKANGSATEYTVKCLNEDEADYYVVDGIAYVYDDAGIAAALKDGYTNITMSAGSFIIPDEAQKKTLTLRGTMNTVIATQDDGSYEGCDYSLDGSTVTFENITINTDSHTYTGYARCSATYNNCTINGTYTLYGNSVFNNCTFNVSGDVYNIWTWGAPTATFTGCTFNSDGKAILLYGTENTKLTVNDCTFNDNGGLTDKKAAIEIGNDYGKSYELVVNNTVVNGYEINDKGINTGTTLWGNKNSMTSANLIVIIDGVKQIWESAGLKDAITNAETGDTVTLPGGEFSLPTLSGKEGITIIGAADGSTVVGGENTSTGFGGNFGKNTTIKNVTFNGSSNGVRYSYAQGGTTTFENCTFAGDSTYGFHIDQSNGATFIFNNCTFSGFNAFAGDLEKVVFNNCTFLHNGNYGHTNIWSVGEFNNCTFGDKASVGTRGDSAHLFFNGVEESYHHEYIGSAESLFAFAKSVNEGGDSWKGQKVSLVADIDLENALWTPIGQTGATEFKGIFDGQGHTIKNLNVDSSAQTGKHYSSGLFGWAESSVTIKNVNIDGATIKGNHNVAVIVGYTYSGKISNCHVTNATIVCTHANDDACGDKCGLIAGYAGDESRFADCSGSNSTVKAGRDGGQLIGAGYNVSVSNCTATNVTVTAGGDCTGDNISNAIIGRVLG